MSRYAGNKPAAPRKGGNPLLTGIVIGMVVGTGMAAGLTWYLMQSPGPFLKKEPVPVKAAEAVTAPAAPVAPAAPAAGKDSGKPRFEFYNVLTDKEGAKAPVRTTEKAAEKHRTTDSKSAAAYVPQILQVGSFANVGDAENLKAKLAMIGFEAHIQTASVPDKGVRHRVRLGPYNSEGEIAKARSFLKQNGVDSTPMRAQ